MAEMRRVPINGELDIVTARVEGRNMAKAMGFGIIDQARIATAISELARNVVLYARSGQITLREANRTGKIGLEITCEDQGPGIKDVRQVFDEETSPGQRSGMGLRGTRRLMDEFEIESHAGIGTKVTARKWLP
jgi:serine/threonine-protein kinase RsbT